MAKFNQKLASTGAARTATGPIKAGKLDQRTGEGAPAFSRDARSDLFLLAVSNFVSEDTFYEGAGARDERFEQLVHQVTAEDSAWMQAFIPWLRNEANMRSASLVAAAEYVKAGGPLGRQVVASAISRADEPSEMIAYWISRHGRQIPQPIKRGVSDAARKFYSERNVLKYGNGGSVQMADVIQLAHVKPKADWQSALFQYVLADRYGNDGQKVEALASLPMLAKNREFRAMNPAGARAVLLRNPEKLAEAGFTWESFSSLGAMDAAAWEAMIPNMGYMALLRNLRNFDQAGVSDKVAAQVAAKLSDPDEVARSRQLPFRFWSAYKNAPSLRWAYALEQALDLATQNVPTFSGKTLILVDTSASMTSGTFSKKSTMTPLQAGALFGAILARKNASTSDLVGFADGIFTHKVKRGESALKIMEAFSRRVGEVGHGTDIARAIREGWSGHDRIVLISDLQTSSYFSRDSAGHVSSSWGTGYYGGYGRTKTPAFTVPTSVPIYAFNLVGYGATSVKAGDVKANEYEFGGMTDKTFSMISMIEQAKTARWPWE